MAQMKGLLEELRIAHQHKDANSNSQFAYACAAKAVNLEDYESAAYWIERTILHAVGIHRQAPPDSMDHVDRDPSGEADPFAAGDA